MEVLFNITPAIGRPAGIGRYAWELAAALPAAMGSDRLTLWSADPERRPPPPPLDRYARIDRPKSPSNWRRLVFGATLVGLPLDRAVGKGDVFHATYHLLPPLRKTATVYTLHDVTQLAAPETLTRAHLLYLNLVTPRNLKSADRIIADSETTRQAALAHYDVDPAKIRTVHLGAPSGYAPAPEAAVAAVRARHGLPDEFLLYVATIEPRKNHALLFRVLREMGDRAPTLVLIGRKGWHMEVVYDALRESGVSDRVRFLIDTPEEDLPAIYTAAKVFLFPSIYEGFGLPLVEAMACGTPVVAAAASCTPEIAGDGAILLPPDDVTAWRKAIEELRSDPASHARWSASGRARAAHFDWNEAARRTVEVYREAHASRT